MPSDAWHAEAARLLAEHAAAKPPPPKRVTLPALPPCAHEGPVVEPCKTCAGEARHVRLCLHPAPSDPDRDTCTRAFVSDRVQACDRCPDRDPPAPASGPKAAPKSSPAARVTATAPPPVRVTPLSKLAVITVAAGESGRALLDVSGPAMRAYAARVGADFHVSVWEGHPGWPMSVKYGARPYLDHYDRILYADADVLFRDDSPDLFGWCAPGELGVVDQLAWHAHQPQHGTLKEYARVRAAMGLRPRKHLPWYFNAGVMVVPNAHRDLLDVPDRPIPPLHCAEEHLLNARVHDRAAAGRLKVRLLDRRANWQHWMDHGFAAAPPGCVLHFSGMRGTDRVPLMRKFAPQPFAPDPFGAPDVAWYVDIRHLRWIRGALASGLFRRTLEIGSYHGWSATAFLDALRAGQIGEAHFCDTHVTDEFRAVLKHYGLADRVVLHDRPSVELLAADSAFDLVFVDGDHREENVREETRRLLAAGVPAVFAHDTSAAKNYGDCGGPQHLKLAFQLAGYHCLEDAVLRDGELTDRGMFFAARTPELYEVGRRALRAVV